MPRVLINREEWPVYIFYDTDEEEGEVDPDAVDVPLEDLAEYEIALKRFRSAEYQLSQHVETDLSDILEPV